VTIETPATFTPLARHRPGALVALGEGGGRTAFDLVRDASALAGALPPASPSSAVLVVCGDRYAFAASLFAAWMCGHAVALPPNTLERTIADLSALPDVRAVLHDGTAAAGIDVRASLAGFAGRAAADDAPGAPPLAIEADRHVVTLFTSGTTGAPRACVKTAAQLLGEAEMLGKGPCDGAYRFLSTVPPIHIYGLLFGVLVPLMHGGVFIRETPLHATTIAEVARRTSADALVSVPAHLRALELLSPGELPSRLRAFSSGAALPPTVTEMLSTRLGLVVTEILGSSETGGIARRDRAGGAWWPLPGVHVSATPDGQMLLDSPFAPRAAERPWPCADRIAPNDDGSFDHLGRLDHVVKVASKRVDLDEMQAALLRLSGVLDAAVFVEGVDPARGARLAAAVVAPAWSAQALRAALAAQFDAVVLPRTILRVDRLPREPSGKLRRDRLLASLEPRAARAAPGSPDLPSTTTMTPLEGLRVLPVGSSSLSTADIVDLAEGRARPVLASDPAVRERLERTAKAVAARVRSGPPIYGVTTGFGASCENAVPAEDAAAMPMNLVRYHGCGTGEPFSEIEAAAIVAARIASLARGYSGVRVAVVEALCALLTHRIVPRIPREGSVGASGDLTPLSYVAAVLAGEREVSAGGMTMPAEAALAAEGLAPIGLLPKESLALMNGTSAMTGLACLVDRRAARLARLAAALTAMTVDVLGGQPAQFDERIFAAKPHPGQATCAGWIRDDLECGPRPRLAPGGRIQDRYSVRCAPHVIGVLVDALAALRPMIETEINGVNDNPLVDPETGDVLHGGNFYGGHIAFAMDALKAAVASVADLLDRQLAQLTSPVTNAGLPENLVAVTGPGRVVHHGFKAMEIAASALTAEALKATMPAAAFSRSTEGHNQDKVSMGTIAARDAVRVLDLTETVAAIQLLALCQAVDLRGRDGCHARARVLHDAVRGAVPMNTGDRRQDGDIARVLEMLRAGELPFGDD
jgi:histidine ammonia-lyase